jgi:hypothetical protein
VGWIFGGIKDNRSGLFIEVLGGGLPSPLSFSHEVNNELTRLNAIAPFQQIGLFKKTQKAYASKPLNANNSTKSSP